jgi:hypothetical protein
MSIFNTKKLTAMSATAPEHLLLGAGVFAKNFTVGTDTYESAKAAGKLLGITTGGGEWKATKNGHYTAVDGTPENTKGTYILDSWASTLQATIKEFTPDTIKMALAAAKIETENNPTGYKKITPKGTLDLADYTDNVTYIGRLVGSEKPVIIQVLNAFNTNDVSIQPKDGDEATVQVIFTGHYAADDNDTPPFAVYYPVEE